MNSAGATFWVDTFRAFSSGLSFTTQYRWSGEDVDEDDPDSWPDVTGRAPGTTRVRFTATVDGELWSNDERDPRPLHLLGGGTIPTLSTVRWWLPRLPTRELSFAFRDSRRGLDGTAALPTLQPVIDARGQVIPLSVL